MNIVDASAAMTTSVDAAFLLSGFRKAGTPFETASTPVIAVQPFANAVRIANRPSSVADRQRGASARYGDDAAGERSATRRRRAASGCRR